VPLIVAANAAVGKSWATLAAWLTAGLASWGVAASSAIDLASTIATSHIDQTTFVIDAGAIVSGVAAGGFLFRPIRRDVAAVLPIEVDNPVHTLALVLAVVLFGTQAASIVFTDALAFLATQSPETIPDVLLDEIPFLIVAAAGVGLVARRGMRASVLRLGFVRPAWWHLVLALAAAGAFTAVILGSEAANHALLPGLADRVDAINDHLFSRLVDTGWAGLVVISVLPGVCEDALFRGALQPRLGVLPTALLFTSIHAQYGLSVVLAGVFVLAVGLGLIRKYTNTTTSMSAHVAYNLLQGVTLAGTLLYAAIAVEAVLVGVAAYAVWRLNRQGGRNSESELESRQ
jgi:membrane protease YdiL (CAAX protease family)